MFVRIIAVPATTVKMKLVRMAVKQIKFIQTRPAILVTIARPPILNLRHALTPTPKKAVQALVKMSVVKVVLKTELHIIRVAELLNASVDSSVVAELVEHLRDVQLLQVIM